MFTLEQGRVQNKNLKTISYFYGSETSDSFNRRGWDGLSPWKSFRTSSETQDVNWTYIRRSEDVQDVFWTSYVRSIYVLCLQG